MASNYYYPTSKNGIQKTLAAQLLNTASTGDAITFSDVDGVENKPGVLVINRVDANGADTPSAREFISYSGTSGNTVLIETRNVDGSGATRTHVVNSIVEFVADGVWGQRVIDQALVSHEVTGLHKSGIALPSPVITTPQINDTSADHQYVLGVSELTADRTITLPLLTGNDDFVFEDHTQTLTNKTLTSPVINGMSGWDGWVTSTDTWTYASASTFTIAGVDRTAVYTKGTRLKFTQTTVKYAVVVSSSFSTNTTVTIAVNTDYTIANAAITLPYYSYQAGPAGYPGWFAWTPSTWNNLTVGSATTSGAYSLIGNTVMFRVRLVFAANTSISGDVTFTFPTSTVAYGGTAAVVPIGWCGLLDASGSPYTYQASVVWASTTTAKIYAVLANSTYTTVAALSSTVPFTWTTSDEIQLVGTYQLA